MTATMIQEKRLDELTAKVKQILAFSNSFAAGGALLEPVCLAKEMVNIDPLQYRGVFAEIGLDLTQHDIGNKLLNDDSPIPHPTNREGYNGEHHLAYWLMGYRLFLQCTELLAEHGVSKGRYFDFGGSTGRVFRHFYHQSSAWDVWSCDFKLTSFRWNREHLPAGIKCFQNMYFPFLPIPDGYFDFISAFSVFTHIDETEEMWLLELARILKAGGAIILTIHNDATWHSMGGELRKSVERDRPDLASLPSLPDGRHVAQWRDDDPYRCNVFHSNGYLRRNWGRFFEVVQIIDRFAGAQAAVLLRKRC
jgi:SAM-dependent methyltransferase